MKKGLVIALSVIAGLVLLVHLSVQIAGNSRKLHETVMKIAEENVDGALGFADLRASAFARFPKIRLTVDSLSLAVPEDAPTDTVAAIDRLSVELNPWQILRGRIKLNEISIDGLRAEVDRVLSLLPEPKEEKDSTSSTKLPLILIDSLSFGDKTSLSYADKASGFRALLDIAKLEASGRVKFAEGCLALEAELGFDSKSVVRTRKYGRMDVPLNLEGRVGIRNSQESTAFDVADLTASLAYLPLLLNGELELFSDSLTMDAVASVTDCPVDAILSKYAVNVLGEAANFTTDALLSLDVQAKGSFTDTEMPSVEACLRVPKSVLTYRPDTLDAVILMDVDAQLEPSGMLVADIHEFEAAVPGLDLKLDGSAEDLLGKDPCYKLAAQANARLEELPSFVPEMIGAEVAEGDIRLDLHAHAHHSELLSYRFDEADIKGLIESGHLEISIPQDSLAASLFNSVVELDSRKEGLDLKFNFDSLYFNSGENLVARVRDIRNTGSITKVKKDTILLPKLQLDSDSESIFVQAGTGRYGVRGAGIGIVAQKMEPRAPRARRPLQLLNPEREFAMSDIDISLDSTLVKYLRGWSTTGHLEADAGFFASPALPLRTRVTALHADFNDRDIMIDTLGVVSGTSDLGISGYIRGVKRSLMRKGRIESRLRAESRRINVNEIVAALSVGEHDVEEVSPSEEFDESFVTDTLADASLELERMPLIVVPGNLDIELNLKADTVNFMNPRIGPFSTGVKIKDRILQLTSTDVSTDFGNIYLDAFYSSKSKSDISTGVNLRLSDIEVEKFIEIIPEVDSLMPMLRTFHGKLTTDFSVTSQLDSNMNFVIPTLDGMARIKGQDMTVDNSLNLGKIANLILFRKQDELKIDNMQVDALIHDSRLEIFPFEFGLDRFKFALRGTQNFDKSMYYHLSVLRSPLPFRVGVNVYGTLDNWRFSLGRARYREGNLPAYTSQLDNVQLNLAKSISNIFARGVDDVIRYNEDAIRGIDRRSDGSDPFIPHHDDLSDNETREYLAMIDNITFEETLARQEEELMEEVESALAASFVDTDKLMQEYEDSIYDKKMMRKIERLKRQAERKAAREARKQNKV